MVESSSSITQIGGSGVWAAMGAAADPRSSVATIVKVLRPNVMYLLLLRLGGSTLAARNGFAKTGRHLIWPHDTCSSHQRPLAAALQAPLARGHRVCGAGHGRGGHLGRRICPALLSRRGQCARPQYAAPRRRRAARTNGAL